MENQSVLEKYLLTNRSWSKGYQKFSHIFGKPLGWLYAFQNGKNALIRLNQKGNCSFFAKSETNEVGCIGFLNKYFDQLKEDGSKQNELPYFYKCAYGRQGAIFGLYYADQLKGFLVLCTIKKDPSESKDHLSLFNQFLQTEVELAYKNYELQNFYETVHPRALALSTMHSVNRIICSSLRLYQLLPQLGRLFAQVLKANTCTIYLVDADSKYLVPKFALKNKKVLNRKPRIRIGSGTEGCAAETAEYYFSKRNIVIPIIGEDVIGVVSLSDKTERQVFTSMDMEILKTLAEQAVVAIKNARLFDETEELTLSSIQVINELLDLSYGNTNVRLPIFSELVFEIGKDLRLSTTELTSLHRATFLIDTGYLKLPEHILTKKANLTKVEFEQIRRHPKIGATVLEKIGVLQPVIPIILHHHERFDGSGYPDGLKGDEIPVGARTVSVVDAFTAMLMHRPHRRSKSVEEAVEEIKKNSGSQFDPRVVAGFLRVMQNSEVSKKVHRFAESLDEVEGEVSKMRS